MRSWKFSKSLSSVMVFGKGSSVLIPGFDSFLLQDANSTTSRLKWGTVTVLSMNLHGSWRTPPGTAAKHITLCQSQCTSWNLKGLSKVWLSYISALKVKSGNSVWGGPRSRSVKKLQSNHSAVKRDRGKFLHCLFKRMPCGFRFDEGDQVLFRKKYAAMFRLLES